MDENSNSPFYDDEDDISTEVSEDEEEVFEKIKLRSPVKDDLSSGGTSSGDCGGEGFFVCCYEALGCPKTFTNSFDFKEHYLSCSYSFPDTCHEVTCFKRPSCKFKNFNELVKHYDECHQSDLVLPSDDGKGIMNVTFSQDFLKVGVEDPVRIKHVGHVEWEDEGEEYGVVFLLHVRHTGPCDETADGTSTGSKVVVQLVPAVYNGMDQPVSHLIQFKLAVLNTADKHVAVSNSSLDQGFTCQTLCSIAEVNAEGNSTNFLTYSKESFLEAFGDTDGFVDFRIKFEVKPYRCRSLIQSKIFMNQFAMTWEDLGLSDKVRRTMKEASEVVPSMLSRIMVPQIGHFADLIVECSDEEGIFNSVSAKILQCALGKPARKSGRKVVAVVLFPRLSALRAAEKKWKERGGKLGLLVSVLPEVNDAVVKSFQEHGCEILLTTPTVFAKVLKLEGNPLSNILLSDLKYVLLMDADYARWDNGLSAFRSCMEQLSPEVRRGLFRVAVSPYIDKGLLEALYNRGFPHLCNVLSLGTKPNGIIDKMEMKFSLFHKLAPRIPEVVSIIRTNKSMRWVIFVIEDNYRSPDHYSDLVNKLTETFGYARVSSAKTEAVLESDPGWLDSFKMNEIGILVTSYFALNYGVLAATDGVILHTLPNTKGDLVRVGHEICGKLCYAFRSGRNDALTRADIFE